MDIDKNEIVRLTGEYGGVWGINHTRRLLDLVAIIGEGLEYNHEAVWLAAHLHDWGAYAHWARPGVDHVARSLQVAEEFLAERDCPPDFTDLVLECIQFHHGAGSDNSIEAVLFSDADALDFLGVVGVLRDFSKNPRDLRKAFEATKLRRETVPGRLNLDKSKEIAKERLEQMDQLYTWFEATSFGHF